MTRSAIRANAASIVNANAPLIARRIVQTDTDGLGQEGHQLPCGSQNERKTNERRPVPPDDENDRGDSKRGSQQRRCTEAGAARPRIRKKAASPTYRAS